MMELEFHMSPTPAGSRPQAMVGTVDSTDITRAAIFESELTVTGLSTAAAMSGITPSRQHRTS